MKKNKFVPKNNSNINSNNCNNIPVFPTITYDNVDTNKCSIIEENINKSGVYRWVNKINGKSYVGSSLSLSKRFGHYYSFGSLTSQVKG